MKTLILTFIFAAALPAAADICGIFRYDDFGDANIRRALIDYSVQPAVTYTIQNADDPAFATLGNNACYCATGSVSDDTRFLADNSMKIIVVQTITLSPKSCSQGPRP